MENPIKIDDLGVPLFLETPMRSDVKNKSSWFDGWSNDIATV